MAMLMESPEHTSNEQMMLCNEDYPEDYVNCAHPQDYTVAAAPIEPQRIYNHRYGRHNRLLWRISWEVAPGKYVPMTFVLDTGAQKQIYLSAQAMAVMEQLKAIQWDDETGTQWVQLFGRKCGVERTPACHDKANIIGLRLLMRLHLAMSDKEPFFTFTPEHPVLKA